METLWNTRRPVIRSATLRFVWQVYFERFTRAGRWFFWPTGAIANLLATSPHLEIYLLFSYASGIWAVALLGALVFRPRVAIRAEHATRACAGEVVPVDVEVAATGRLGGLELRVVLHEPPPGVESDPPGGAPVRHLARGERARVRLGVRCERRGVHRLGGLRVETSFPLGLLVARREFAEERSLLVYPRFRPLARLELPSGRRHQPGGVALASVIGDAAEFIGDREFREGDSVRDIDWRATARLDRLVVREYREEYFVRVALILDTHVPPAGRFSVAKPPRRDDFERAVSLCAAIGDRLAREEFLVDIFAAGPSLYHLTAGRSLAYLDQILDILACVEESPTAAFERIEPELGENLARLSAVIVLLLDWDEPRRAFVRRLRAQGVGVRVIVARDARPTIDPAGDPEADGAVPVIGREAFERGVEEL